MKICRIIALISLISLGSCTPQYVTKPLPLPERPELPIITEQEGAQISHDIWARIVKRDLALKQFVEKLELIIKATHEDVQK